MAPNLQEQMLLQGQVDVSAVFTATSYMNLVALKLDPEKDFRWIFYSDSGIDLYSNGAMVSQKLAKQRPQAVKGLLRAINRSMREVLAAPDTAIALLAKKEPLLNQPIEKQRLLYVTRTLIATPEARSLGIGDINDARMSASMDAIAAAFELPRKPALADVFSRSFLPPKDERTVPEISNQ
jgi:NitT/TauT family transport system substrate-binding protein